MASRMRRSFSLSVMVTGDASGFVSTPMPRARMSVAFCPATVAFRRANREWRARTYMIQRSLERAVIVRNQRDHHVRAVLCPTAVQNADLLAVREPDHEVHQRTQLGGAECPPTP